MTEADGLIATGDLMATGGLIATGGLVVLALLARIFALASAPFLIIAGLVSLIEPPAVAGAAGLAWAAALCAVAGGLYCASVWRPPRHGFVDLIEGLAIGALAAYFASLLAERPLAPDVFPAESTLGVAAAWLFMLIVVAAPALASRRGLRRLADAARLMLIAAVFVALSGG